MKLLGITVFGHFELFVIPVLTKEDYFDQLHVIPSFDFFALLNYLFFKNMIIGYSSKIIIGAIFLVGCSTKATNDAL